MSLMLTILTAPASVSISESSRTFGEMGGTIGRGSENTWVLEDPERFLSSLHCQVSGANGQYFLTDLSTNGTFLNGSAEPIGKGCKLPINDGDKFVLGDYEFSVSLWSPVQSPLPAQDPISDSGPFSGNSSMSSLSDDDLFQPLNTQNDPFEQNSAFGSSPFNGGLVSSTDSLFSSSPVDTDPLAMLDKARGSQVVSNDWESNPFSGQAAPDPFSMPIASDPFAANSFSDQADALNQQINWPDAVAEPDESKSSMIPDDWDDDFFSTEPAAVVEPKIQSIDDHNTEVVPGSYSQATSAAQVQRMEQPAMPVSRLQQSINPPPKVDVPVQEDLVQTRMDNITVTDDYAPRAQHSAIENANAKIEAELAILKKQILSQQQRGGTEITVDTTMVNAMGINVKNLTDEQVSDINEKAGEVIREAVKGLMKVLSSRSSIKNEFRMNVTTIQPVENNPLKFSVNVDDALENMFVKQGNAYKKPVEAVQEGFEGVAEHQVAIIAGIRAAFRGVIERFDPVKLEERFSRQKKGGLIPVSQKSKNWEFYTEYFNELVGDMDSSFQYLFGDEFVQAYEDQLRKLAMARKSRVNMEDK